MLGFRRKLNEDPELVKLLCTRFVPVAVDHEVERRIDAEGKLYLKVAGKAVSNSVFAFDPSGKVLFQRLGDEIYQKFAPALVAAVKDYRPAKALAADVPSGDDRDEHFYPIPEGATIVHVTSRVVSGDQGWPGSKTWGRDNLWILPDEVAALAKGELPDKLKLRIARCHLINTTGVHLHANGMWRPQDIRQISMTLDGGRLSGEVWLEAERLEGKYGDFHSYYKAKLFGFVAFDGDRLSRFDVVAVGPACRLTQGSCPGLANQGHPGRPYTLGIGFRLTSDQDSDSQRRTPPAAMHHGGKAAYAAYLK